jgi:probable phosphoglycerate mutase
MLQAAWLHDSLTDVAFDAIYTSPSGRTVHTAKILCGSRSIPVIETDLLKEINMGEWEGRLNEDIRKLYPKEHRSFWEFPHEYEPASGESFKDVYERAKEIIEYIIKEHCGRNVLVVTHAAMLKTILRGRN